MDYVPSQSFNSADAVRFDGERCCPARFLVESVEKDVSVILVAFRNIANRLWRYRWLKAIRITYTTEIFDRGRIVLTRGKILTGVSAEPRVVNVLNQRKFSGWKYHVCAKLFAIGAGI